MRRLTKRAWLTFASSTSVVVGIVWLVWLVRSDARRAAMRVDSGETVTVEYDLDDPHEFSPEERTTIAELARRALPDIRRALPEAPASIVLRVTSAPSDKVVAETGDAASVVLPNIVAWRVDAKRSEGVAAIARAQLRPMLFHEVHHLARTAEIRDYGNIRDDVVCEGLATAFERDYGWGGVAPPWGQVPPDVEVWAREVLTLPKNTPQKVWNQRHPGQRWLVHRVGAFIVDCAARESGKTSSELLFSPADTLIAMCPTVAGHREGGAAGSPTP